MKVVKRINLKSSHHKKKKKTSKGETLKEPNTGKIPVLPSTSVSHV